MSKSVLRYYKWYGPLSHSKTLVVRPLKKTFFYVFLPKQTQLQIVHENTIEQLCKSITTSITTNEVMSFKKGFQSFNLTILYVKIRVTD